jgi:hypothetical protein
MAQLERVLTHSIRGLRDGIARLSGLKLAAKLHGKSSLLLEMLTWTKEVE